MVIKRQKKFSLFYIYSLYIDTPEYLADTIINDVCMPLEILKERYIHVEDKTYVLVYVKFAKKYIERYRRFLDILKYNMLMFNNDEYINDCRRLVGRLNNDKIFGGNWG